MRLSSGRRATARAPRRPSGPRLRGRPRAARAPAGHHPCARAPAPGASRRTTGFAAGAARGGTCRQRGRCGNPRSRSHRRSRTLRRRGREPLRRRRGPCALRGSRSLRAASRRARLHSRSTSPIIRRSPATVSCGKSPTPGSTSPPRPRYERPRSWYPPQTARIVAPAAAASRSASPFSTRSAATSACSRSWPPPTYRRSCSPGTIGSPRSIVRYSKPIPRQVARRSSTTMLPRSA